MDAFELKKLQRKNKYRNVRAQLNTLYDLGLSTDQNQICKTYVLWYTECPLLNNKIRAPKSVLHKISAATIVKQVPHNVIRITRKIQTNTYKKYIRKHIYAYYIFRARKKLNINFKPSIEKEMLILQNYIHGLIRNLLATQNVLGST